jgi:hypothetical protein
MLTDVNGKLHDDEVDIDVALVRRLLRTQYPHWSELPIEQVDSTGTVNAVFRLGRFHAAVNVDDDTWSRARGWALTRISNVAYHATTNPRFAADAVATITEALADEG